MNTQPILTFFCELDIQPLEKLLADPDVVAVLKQLQAGVAMGLRDLSEKRADVVKRLNRAGIPLTAWLLLPESQGYWFNLDNACAAAQQYEDFLHWSQEHGLEWKRVGLDIEPDFRFLTGFKKGFLSGFECMARSLAHRRKNFAKARESYRKLVSQIKADGFEVESYQLPLILDERRVNSTVMQRLLGVLDLAVDREVVMLYSSFYRPNGDGFLVSYGKDCEYIAIGSTGGGVDLEGVADTRPMSWEEFSRDLRIANCCHREIAIFSLEGCVQQGFLNRLPTFDWQVKPRIDSRRVRWVELLRSGLRGILWLLSRPLLPLVLLALWLGWRLSRRR
ncbi:MAG: hypothetical protein ROW48_15235 [Bellilinea sp.]|jgi:hypothetical protein